MNERPLKPLEEVENADGSINWSNFFTNFVNHNSSHPAPDFIPQGRDIINDIEQEAETPEQLREWILERLDSIGFVTTYGYVDPVVFPEVVEPEFQDIFTRINRQSWIRTLLANVGNAYDGFGPTMGLSVAVDTQEPKAEGLRQSMDEMMHEFLSGREHLDSISGELDWQEPWIPPRIKKYGWNVRILPPPSFYKKMRKSPKGREIKRTERDSMDVARCDYLSMQAAVQGDSELAFRYKQEEEKWLSKFGGSLERYKQAWIKARMPYFVSGHFERLRTEFREKVIDVLEQHF